VLTVPVLCWSTFSRQRPASFAFAVIALTAAAAPFGVSIALILAWYRLNFANPILDALICAQAGRIPAMFPVTGCLVGAVCRVACGQLLGESLVSRILNFPHGSPQFFNASGASLPCRQPSGILLFLAASQQTARLYPRPTTSGRLDRKRGDVSLLDRVFEQLGIPAASRGIECGSHHSGRLRRSYLFSYSFAGD
jgi:hypothetical protein